MPGRKEEDIPDTVTVFQVEGDQVWKIHCRDGVLLRLLTDCQKSETVERTEL